MLWSERGAKARSYLSGRGLREETVREARLGYWPADEHVEGIYPDCKIWIPRGIVIPWFDGSDITLINIRRPEGDPKYVAVRGSHRGGLFPGRSGIVAGKPLVIVEGEFDALLLGQELADVAAVVTLGSAGNKPSARIKNAMLTASRWIVAGDADGAGEKSAEGWLASSDRCVRVAPPQAKGKDWTEAYQNGLDLKTWWQEQLRDLRGQASPQPAERHLPAPSSEPNTVVAESIDRVVDASVMEPPRYPWRDLVADWPDDWRLRWDALANAYCAAGMPWKEAEKRAAAEAEAERKAAGSGPPPVMVPDPSTALWRDWLMDLIATGKAARYLPPSEFGRALSLPSAQPLDGDTIRSVVMAIQNCALGGAMPRPRHPREAGDGQSMALPESVLPPQRAVVDVRTRRHPLFSLPPTSFSWSGAGRGQCRKRPVRRARPLRPSRRTVSETPHRRGVPDARTRVSRVR